MDEARNMALLFFVDHLMLKGGQRTIHDLSCQFGARGFTEEMRQAVGTTQEGLTEFLAQFPSLFILDGDQIVLKGFGEVEGKNHLMHIPATGRQRDYAAEAVQFFIQKLEKFGPELQIKSLLGHRSQAAPEVRLVSGRHLKEFADFLAAQTDHFIVEGDRVRLKNMPEPKAHGDEYLDEEGRPLAGHRAKLAAIEYMKEVLEQNEEQPIPLDQFYRKFCERFPHHFRQEVATNPKELLMFLKLNRHIFFIRSNKVQLVRNRPAGEEFGSESGRSTEDATGSERSATSPEENGKNNNNDHNDQQKPTMFPLNRENLGRVQVAKTLRQAQESIHALRADLDSDSSAVPFVSVDFKVVNIGTHQHLEQFIALIVVCCPAGERIIVFDLAHCEGILTESGLAEMFEADQILKVTHDVRRVSQLLANRYGIKLHNVFDTQIAHSVIQHHKFGKPMGELRAISFVNLQRVYYPQSLVLSDVSPRKLSQTPNWADRPISPDLLLSACEECHCLANGLFRLLHSQMPQQLRPLFEQLSAEALQMPQQNGREMTGRNGNNNNWNGMTNGNGGMILPTAERRVQPLLELPMNGIYRPPAVGHRRGSCQTPQQPSTNGHCQFSQGGYIPPPLRKVSAPSFQQSPLMGQRRQPNQFVANRPEMREMGTQTISTGEIAVLKVYYDETEEINGQQHNLVTKNAVMNGKSANVGNGLSNGTK